MSTNIVLLIVFLLVSALYVPLNRRKSRYYWASRYDRHIPLIPIFVLPYISFFPYIAFTVGALWNTLYETPLLIALIVAKSIALTFWYVFPNGVMRPEITGNTWFHRFLFMIYRHDRDGNGFPSSHVFVSLICAYFLAIAYPVYTPVIWIIAILIVFSTVFTKQHYVVDVFGGGAMAALSLALVLAFL